jgi:heterodisulfide reductase subunit B
MGGDLDKVIGQKAHTVPIDSVIKELKEVEK